MTTKDKLEAVQRSPEVKAAISLMVAAFEDCELQSHIRFVFTVENCKHSKYEITLMPIVNQVSYQEDGK